MRLNKQAFVLPSIIITTVFLTAIGVLVTELAVNNFKVASADRYVLGAQLAADAGIDATIVEINLDNSYPGTTGEVELLNDGNIRTTYQTQVSGLENKLLTSIGRTYRPATSTTPEAVRTYEVELNGLGPLDLGSFSVITGVGGLILENSAKIVAGDVYVNGTITMSNTTQIGTATNEVFVRAAHQSCPNPPDATYPTVCASGENGEPITATNSAYIYGDVIATNQVEDSFISNLNSGTAAVQPLPDHDRDAQKAAAIANPSISASSVSCDSNTGTRIIPADTRITGGDVFWGKKCEITILGDVWIEGNLNMAQTAKVIIDDSVGSTMPTMMVDGSNGASFNNGPSFVANGDGTGLRLITYYSTASCSPDCADVTGPDLADSDDYPTIYMDQSFSAPESILYARWTQLLIDNSGDIGALLGQTVKMRNSTAVTFGTSVTGGGGDPAPRTYLIDGYRRIIN